ncbi:MAG: hypothetical protein IJT20_01385 [Synergistaceae bacterium]|nr:hypothetical protein [Synergistaceae bacterium]
MKKLILCALLVAVIVAFASPVMAWDIAKQKNLGQDKNKMTWYLLDYGKDSDGVPFAVSRKYYTNTTVKNETIELLMSKFGISPEVAGSLYFTEYGYQYNENGSQFALTYLRHYDMLGNEIHGTEYGTDENPKTFAAIPAGSTPAKGAAYALGKSVSSSSTAKKGAVPTKKVKAKKK